MSTGYTSQVQAEFEIMDQELKDCLMSVLEGCRHNTLDLPAIKETDRYVIKARERQDPENPALRAMITLSDRTGKLLRIYSSYAEVN